MLTERRYCEVHFDGHRSAKFPLTFMIKLQSQNQVLTGNTVKKKKIHIIV